MVNCKKKRNRKKIAHDQFVEFCENSTIHGVKYLGERNRPFIERTCWIVMFIISFYICGTLMNNLWRKWNDSPSVVTLSEVPTAVWEIPFPAVTICSENKIRAQEFNLNDLMTGVSNMTESEIAKQIRENFPSIMLVCNGPESHKFISLLKNPDKKFSEETIDTLKKISLKKNETFESCTWRDTKLKCLDYVTEMLTHDGFCYTFNTLDAADLFRENVTHYYDSHGYRTTEWNLDDGYSDKTEEFSYPLRTLNSGPLQGFSVRLMFDEKNRDFLCRFPVDGFKIAFHSPAEIPRMTKNFYWVPNNNYMLVGIKPQLIWTSERLRKYEPFKRRCFFEGEKYLKFFKIYTQVNCEQECFANLTLEKCGCVQYHMPRYKDTPICTPHDNVCIQEADDHLFSSKPGLKDDDSIKNFPCDCIPGCSTISYDVELSSIGFDFKEYFRVAKIPKDKTERYELTHVNAYFKKNHFIASRRIELYGFTDLLANVGGLLGLFMGFSMLSVVEILYFCTLRLYNNLKMKRENTNNYK